jgi:hypothetical protein
MFALATSACSGATCPNRPASERGTSGEDIIRRLKDRYEKAASYRDNGVVVTVAVPDGSEASFTRTEFQTVFVRTPSRFRFEFARSRDSAEKGVIWRDGDRPAQAWTLCGAAKAVDLREIFAEFSGISRGSSYQVPTLLYGVPNHWVGLAYVVDGDESLNGLRCVRLVAHEDGRVIVLWVSKDDLALRRMMERAYVSGARAAETIANLPPFEGQREKVQQLGSARAMTFETIIEWTPQFDVPIDASAFAFTPAEP